MAIAPTQINDDLQHGLEYARSKFSTGDRTGPSGLKIDAEFCPSDVDSPFDTVQWELRSAAIKDETGKALFEQNDCEVPSSWSQLATNVVVSKYFYGDPEKEERETSVRQLIYRVTRTIADWGLADGYFDTPEDGERFYRDLTWLCVHQHGAFNSPVWFNVGLYQQYGVSGAKCNWHYDKVRGRVDQPENPYEYPQGSACFIQKVEDNMEDIMRLATSEAMLFKFGSGTGTDLSSIRSQRELLSGGGRPSGPLSFMRVYDQIAAVVKSGGKTRRAAKMQSLKVWHPDILEFIQCKWSEEQKAHALIREGYESNFNGEAYSSVMFQNANLSVRVTDDYMQAVRDGGRWQTRWISDKNNSPAPEYDARELLNTMAECAWNCGDPGVQYDTTINAWHTCPNSGPINASNPCSEYMFLDDTACNLASINLMNFRKDDGSFDVDRFQAACRLFLIAQEILVDHASYPTADIAMNSHLYRPLGLGYSNLGSLIMTSGLPYDSDAARALCGSLTALMHGAANLTSAEMAGVVGTFEGFDRNRQAMLAVMGKHRDAVEHINDQGPEYLKDSARALWDKVLDLGNRYGFRNAQTTVLAPTGTISFLMDCDTTGIEPDIALVKYKQLAGGGMLKIVNRGVEGALESLGYDSQQTQEIIAFIDANDTIEGAPHLSDEHLPVFDCAFTPAGGTRSIAWQAHVTMMAAAQPFLSGAISKTVNMPHDSTPQDIADAYFWGWELGLKAIAIYRDGSKQSQPLNTKSGAKTAADAEQATVVEKVVYRPRRERLEDTRHSLTHKFNIAGHEGYINVGLYPDGRPGEVFITMAKEGSTIGGLMDSFGTSTSIALQYGVPLEVLVNKFTHTRFEPMGHTSNPDIRIAKSIVDYIFRWLGITFLAGYREATVPGAAEKAKEAAAANVAAAEPATGKIGGGNASGSGSSSFGANGIRGANGSGGAKASGGATNGDAMSVPLATPVVDNPASSSDTRADQLDESAAMKLGGNGPASDAPETAARFTVGDLPKVDIEALERAGVSMQMSNGDGSGGSDSHSVGSRSDQFARFQSDAPSCDNCGSITVRNGNCYLCHNCGASMGCS